MFQTRRQAPSADDTPRAMKDPASLLRWTVDAHPVNAARVQGRGFDDRSIRRNVLEKCRSLRWFELLHEARSDAREAAPVPCPRRHLQAGRVARIAQHRTTCRIGGQSPKRKQRFSHLFLPVVLSGYWDCGNMIALRSFNVNLGKASCAECSRGRLRKWPLRPFAAFENSRKAARLYSRRCAKLWRDTWRQHLMLS